MINNTEPAQVMAEIGSTCVEIEDSAFLSFIRTVDETKKDFYISCFSMMKVVIVMTKSFISVN